LFLHVVVTDVITDVSNNNVVINIVISDYVAVNHVLANWLGLTRATLLSIKTDTNQAN